MTRNPFLPSATSANCDAFTLPIWTARVSFSAQANVRYYVQAGGYAGRSGNLAISFARTPPLPNAWLSPTPTTLPSHVQNLVI